MTTYYFFSLLLPFMHGAIVSCIFINLLSHGSFPYSNIKVLSFILIKDSQHCVNHFNLTWFTFSNPTFNDWITFNHSSCFKSLHVFWVKTLKALQWTWKYVWFKHSTTFLIFLVKSYLTLNQLFQLDLISFLNSLLNTGITFVTSSMFWKFMC
jgi:hypothetical protein